MKFKYTDYSSELRPVLPIMVYNPKTDASIGYTVLVDSAAEVCLFESEIAKIIGLDSATAKDIEYIGIGGNKVECFVHEVVIQLGGWSHTIDVRIVAKSDDRKIPYGLVGQKGFFQFFKITFDRAHEMFEVQK